MCACDWLQVCLSGCRLSPGADWFQSGSQGFKDRLLPVPGASPLLSKTAGSCATVYMLCLNKTVKTLAAGGVWGTGRGKSHFLKPGFPLGPGHNSR